MIRTPLYAVACAVTLGAWLHAPVLAQQGATDGQWRAFAGDPGATKYSALGQITKGNVGDLTIAWRRPSVDASILEHAPEARDRGLIGTPLMVDGVLYSPNGVGLVEAFDPGTGTTLWVQEPMGARPDSDPRDAYLTGASTRGVAHWTDASDSRILVQRGQYLYALDARTGQSISGFGTGGRVDLTAELQEGARYRWPGAPTVVGDVVVLGNAMRDVFSSKEFVRGDVQAFDVRTGELKWMFHTVPQAGEFGIDTWEDDSWRYSGHAPVWSLFSADTELGLVYMPVSSSTNDMYGGHRLGDNLFSQSLVCVDAETGERVWHYQFVHHGLWDYDTPAAPILMDLVVDGRPVRAVAQITKQAFVYVLDRLTGEPVWPIEERAVPRSLTPGERTSPTQPFPTKPPPFDRQGSTEDNLIDFTPELRAEALEIVARYTTGPLFTPPSIRVDGPEGNLGTIQLPGSQGGADVQGASFDPETNTLFVPSITSPFVADIIPGDPDGDLNYVMGGRMWIAGPRGLPLSKPPYGRITAIDMNAGEIIWQVPNGNGPRDHPAIRHLGLGQLGSPGRAAPLATGTLFFIGEGSDIAGGPRVPEGMPPEIVTSYGEPWFRAYDKETGEVVWEMRLPAGTTGAPMTYMHEGRQYIVVAVGGRDVPAEFIALSLPQR